MYLYIYLAHLYIHHANIKMTKLTKMNQVKPRFAMFIAGQMCKYETQGGSSNLYPVDTVDISVISGNSLANTVGILRTCTVDYIVSILNRTY